MIDEHQVREMLHRRANAVPAIVVDALKAARRARRRLVANGAVAVLAAAAIAVATLAGVDAIRSAPVPADRPTPSPAPGVLRANGEVLSFTGVPFESPGDLVAVNPETGEERVLAEDLDDVSSASWSEDGRWVAYETRTPPPEGIGELWVVGASQEPRRVVDGPSRWMWSSRGAELAAIRLRSPVSNIAGSTLTIDPATGETTSAVSIPERVGDVTSGPAWSPDGTRLVFGTGDGAIYSIDVRSGASSLLVRPPAEHLGEDVFQIVWSPDGAHIGFATTGGVYVMDAQGSNVRVLQDEYSRAGVAWSPDGTRLAYEGDEGVIWAAPTDGSAPTEIGRPLPSSCYLLCPPELIWSPDGSQIAFRLIWIRDGGDVSVEVSALDADGRGEAERIDELTYQSWDGGSYSGEYAWF